MDRTPKEFGGPFRKDVDLGDGTHARGILAFLERDLIGGAVTNRRILVDCAQISFHRGRQFRTSHEFNIPDGTTSVIRIETQTDAVLHQMSIDIDAGALRVKIVDGGTQGGVFSTTLDVVAKNTMSSVDQPPYSTQTSITTGGTLTGGNIIDISRVTAVTTQNMRHTIGTRVDDYIGIPAGVYYVTLESIGSVPATGTFKAWFEEL